MLPQTMVKPVVTRNSVNTLLERLRNITKGIYVTVRNVDKTAINFYIKVLWAIPIEDCEILDTTHNVHLCVSSTNFSTVINLQAMATVIMLKYGASHWPKCFPNICCIEM